MTRQIRWGAVRVTPGDHWFPSLHAAFTQLGIPVTAGAYQAVRDGRPVRGHRFAPWLKPPVPSVPMQGMNMIDICPCCGSQAIAHRDERTQANGLKTGGGRCLECRFSWTTVGGALTKASRHAIAAHKRAIDPRRPPEPRRRDRRWDW